MLTLAWTAQSIAAASPDSSSQPRLLLVSPVTITIPLERHEVSYSVMNWSMAVSHQPDTFKREPPSAGPKICRGRLNLQGSGEPPLPFWWNCTEGKLHLDLNRNEDLTDDPSGVFLSRSNSTSFSSYTYGQFTNIHLTLGTGSNRAPCLVDLNLSDYGSRLYVYAGIRSFWAGKVVLAGGEWQVGVVENRLGGGSPYDGTQLLIRPWARRDEPFTLYDGSLDAFSFPRQLFVESRLYEINRTTLPDGDQWRPRLVLKEQPAELGDLNLTGSFIQRVLLAEGLSMIVVEPTKKTIRVPIGRYADCKVALAKGSTKAFPERNGILSRKSVVVTKDKPATLVAGGPLTNSVTIRSRGRTLVFDYHLVGAGGESYQLPTRDPLNPPRFIVYQNDRKIASGKFEFG